MSDPRDVPATQLLHTIASSLIDQPEFLAIKTTAAEDGVTFTIKTNPGDTGKLIGKQGRTARSIRTVMGAAGMKVHRRYTIDISEEHLGS